MADQTHDNNKIPGSSSSFRNLRVAEAPLDTYDPSQPRIGRRESEPHSEEVTYVHDVLQTNFPSDRAIWDLHHYFPGDPEEIDIRFDISFFKGLSIDHSLSSYHAKDYDNKVPTLTINVLSVNTWRSDIGETYDLCSQLGIPVYIVFAPYHVATQNYRPPFLRVYSKLQNGEYVIKELHKVVGIEGAALNFDAIFDLGPDLPFQVGLLELKKRHERNQQRYR